MSELSVGSLSGLAANSYVVDIASGSTLDLSNATDLPASALPAGSILQVVSTAKTDIFSTTSTTAVDITGLTATITPSATSSKIFILVTIGAFSPEAGNTGNLQIARDGTALNISTGGSSMNSGGLSVTSGATYGNHTESISYLDSPSSTSALTYSAQVFAQSGSTLYVNRWVANDTRRATSTITVMEVAG